MAAEVVAVRFSLEGDGDGDGEESSGKRSPSPPLSANILAASIRSRNLTSVSIHSCPTSLGMDSFPELEKDKMEAKSRKIRRYYKKQLKLVQDFKEDNEAMDQYEKRNSEPNVELLEKSGKAERKASQGSETKRSVTILTTATLAINVALLVAKIVAVVLSGSLAIVSSVVDSAVDITTGLVIWLTSRAIKNRDPYMYPRGRTRLEPLGLVIISVVMAVASIQMVIQSIEAIVRGNLEPDVGIPTIVIMSSTVAMKLCLAILCYCYRGDPSIAVLGQDHRNDCISNTVAMLCAFLADRYWGYLDPIGAIVVSLYIAVTWFYTGYGQISVLSGRSAEPAFINRIIKICLEHDTRVLLLDTVYVYHFGTKFLVEVHIVMDGTISLMEAHDISEPLQQKIESLSYVERAFVHVDYDTEHRPEEEHKIV